MLRSIPLKKFEKAITMNGKIVNPQTGEETTGMQLFDLTYRELIEAVLQQNKPGGATIEYQRKVFQIWDALDQAVAAGKDVLLLEEQKWQFFQGLVVEMPWAIVNRHIVTFADDVANALRIDLNAATLPKAEGEP